MLTTRVAKGKNPAEVMGKTPAGIVVWGLVVLVTEREGHAFTLDIEVAAHLFVSTGLGLMRLPREIRHLAEMATDEERCRVPQNVRRRGPLSMLR